MILCYKPYPWKQFLCQWWYLTSIVVIAAFIVILTSTFKKPEFRMMEVIESPFFFFLVSLYSTILHCFATYEIVGSPHCQFIPNSFLLGSVWNPDCVRERKKNTKENYFHMFGFAKKYKRKKNII